MHRFEPCQLLTEFGPLPLAEEFKRSDGTFEWYQRVAPFRCASFERGFFFEIHLVEKDFRSVVPQHGEKTTLCFAAPLTNKKKGIRQSNGEMEHLPVVAFYIYVNRGVFHPLSPGENEVEWLHTLPLRTRGIAHELLIAEQYLNGYNIEQFQMPHAITIPHAQRENEAMCPFFLAEQWLCNTEMTYGVRLKTVEEFNFHEDSTAVQSYYAAWLRNRGVEKDACLVRTREYLQTNFRSSYQEVIPGLLDATGLRDRIKTGSVSASLPHHLSITNEEGAEFIKQIGNSFPSIDLRTIRFATERVLRNNH